MLAKESAAIHGTNGSHTMSLTSVRDDCARMLMMRVWPARLAVLVMDVASRAAATANWYLQYMICGISYTKPAASRTLSGHAPNGGLAYLRCMKRASSGAIDVPTYKSSRLWLCDLVMPLSPPSCGACAPPPAAAAPLLPASPVPLDAIFSFASRCACRSTLSDCG